MPVLLFEASVISLVWLPVDRTIFTLNSVYSIMGEWVIDPCDPYKIGDSFHQLTHCQLCSAPPSRVLIFFGKNLQKPHGDDGVLLRVLFASHVTIGVLYSKRSGLRRTASYSCIRGRREKFSSWGLSITCVCLCIAPLARLCMDVYWHGELVTLNA